MNAKTPIPELIKEMFRYNKRTGEFTRIKVFKNMSLPSAGVKRCDPRPKPTCSGGRSGTQVFSFGTKFYQAARVAWFLATGEQPPTRVCTKNGDKKDLRFSNLVAGFVQSKHRAGIPSGVSWDINKKKYKVRLFANSTPDEVGLNIGHRDTVPTSVSYHQDRLAEEWINASDEQLP